MRTYTPNPADLDRAWHLVDADGLILGRMATEVASRLRGKHRPYFTPNLLVGDHVVVINAAKVILTGDTDAKLAYRHSGYPGGLKSRTYTEMLAQQPAELVRRSIKGMLPHNRLGRQMLSLLKVYAGPEHPHAAQNPEPLEIAGARRSTPTA